MAVYRNAIGEPVAHANIYRVRVPAHTLWSKVEGERSIPAREYWSGCPSHEFSDDATAADVVEELEADGWDCQLLTDGFGRPMISATHRETQRAIDEAIAASNARFADAERGYLRYGDLPEGGRSRNHRDGFLEAGVSCFHAEFAKDGSWRLLTGCVTKIDALMLAAAGAKAYRLWGTEVGTGSDGEPLLAVDRCEEVA